MGRANVPASTLSLLVFPLMAPSDKIRLPFRWQFTPVQNLQDGSIFWTWHAYTHSGELTMKSDKLFDTLTECVADAKTRGYEGS
jgi:hypothetical protein